MAIRVVSVTLDYFIVVVVGGCARRANANGSARACRC